MFAVHRNARADPQVAGVGPGLGEIVHQVLQGVRVVGIHVLKLAQMSLDLSCRTKRSLTQIIKLVRRHSFLSLIHI